MWDMTEQEAREFIEMLAVPERSQPPPCPLCQTRHRLELRCAGERRAPAGALGFAYGAPELRR
jgi:hypothetical protein